MSTQIKVHASSYSGYVNFGRWIPSDTIPEAGRFDSDVTVWIDPEDGVGVNWPGMGTVPAAKAKEFAETMAKAAKVAGILQQHLNNGATIPEAVDLLIDSDTQGRGMGLEVIL